MKQEKWELVKQFYRGNLGWLLLSVGCSLSLVGVNLLLSWMIQQITDSITGQKGTVSFGVLCGLSVGLVAAIVGAKLVDCVAMPHFLKKAMQQYKEFVFFKLLEKNVAAFQKVGTAEYLSAMSNDANNLEVGFLEKQFSIVYQSVIFFGAFGMMLRYSVELTVISLVLAVIPMASAAVLGKRMKQAQETVAQSNAALTQTMKDSLNGFSVVKSFRAEKEIFEVFCRTNQKAEEAKQQKRKMGIVVGMIGAAAGATAQIGVFLSGAYLALSGKGITAGVVLVFVQLMNFVIEPIVKIPQDVAECRAALTNVQRLAQMLEEHTNEEKQNILKELKKEIRLENVMFGYENKQPILKNISARFEMGKSYAVVGSSGSGKSTLLKMCMGVYQPNSGKVWFDGQESKTVNRDSIYNVVSAIQQEVFVFQASVLENITMFRNFLKKDVEKAAQAAGLGVFLQEKGGDYLCGENGCRLSGGERQRVSIARCLLRKTPVLLVDEATAALDQKTARQIADTILNLKNILRIVVTHQLDGDILSRYDSILVMKNGVVEEMGTFKELMEKKGYFYSLYTVSQ